MRLLIPNATARIHASRQTGTGEYGEPETEAIEIAVEGLLTSLTESANIGDIDPRYSSYEYSLSLTGAEAEKAETVRPKDTCIIGGEHFTIREVSEGYRSIALRRSRIQSVLNIYMDRAG